MIKREEIQGIPVDIGTYEEYRNLLISYLDGKQLNTAEIIGMNTVLMSEKHPLVTQSLQQTDLVIPADQEIADAISSGRTEETGGSESAGDICGSPRVLHALFEYIAAKKKTVYLIMKREDALREFVEFLGVSYEDGVQIAGAAVLDEDSSQDNIVNDINAVVPDLVLAVLECPVREQFLHEHRNMINAGLYLTMSFDRIPLQTSKKSDNPFRRFLIGKRENWK